MPASTAADIPDPDVEAAFKPINADDDTVTLGKYTQCVHYRDGLFSSVFRAANPDASDRSTAEDPANAFVAIKLTTPSQSHPPHDPVREIRLLETLKAQQIIPLLSSFSAAGGRLAFAMPFYPLDLATLLARPHRRRDETVIRSVMHDLFAALAATHKAGILHRDVKPSNVLLRSARGPAVLSDYGIAWRANDESSEPATDKITDVGTGAYRPPEILFGKRDYDSALDMWAAGCVQAECIRSRAGAPANEERTALFEAGDAGTELALIASIFSTLGTPDGKIWPESKKLPDFGKFQWKDFPARSWEEILPGARDDERDLVAGLVRFESGSRLSAEQALSLAYFSS